MCACLVLGAQADGHEVVTVEGLADGERLHRVQAAFVEAGRRAMRVLHARVSSSRPPTCSSRNPIPSDDEIREALSGNICRCTGYAKIFDAVRLAAGVR